MALTAAQQAASYYARKRRRGRVVEPVGVDLSRIGSPTTASAVGASVGLVGLVNVAADDIGDYTLTLSNDASGKFSITGALVKVAGALSAGVYTIEVSADNGVDDPVTKQFKIIVT